jgi:hypothetical protein
MTWVFQVQNGFEMECSDEESTKESFFKPKVGAVPKSPQGSKMDWKSQTVRPPGPGYFPSHFRPLHMPPMVGRGVFKVFIISTVNYSGCMWFLLYCYIFAKITIRKYDICQIWHTELKWIPAFKILWQLIKYVMCGVLYTYCVGHYMHILWILVTFRTLFNSTEIR